jgi:flagellar protein FlaJ
MSEYLQISMKIFGPVTDFMNPYFPNLKSDLKKARIKMSTQEYLSSGIFLSFLLFTVELPLLSFIFSLLFKNFLFGFLTSITMSFFLLAIFFLSYVNYPKAIIKERASSIDKFLPFASLYLATIASSKLPLVKIFELFSKFGQYGALSSEFNQMQNEISLFGLDANTALERAIERTPSKNLKELLYGILATNTSGGDLSVYLKQKSNSFFADYNRRLHDFAQQLTVYIEIYLTSIVLGAIFFVILTAILAGISGTGGNIIFLQFFLIFLFLPLISGVFVFLIKTATPGGQE